MREVQFDCKIIKDEAILRKCIPIVVSSTIKDHLFVRLNKPELTKLNCDQRNYDKQWSMVKGQFW
jgi:hypothetical protein